MCSSIFLSNKRLVIRGFFAVMLCITMPGFAATVESDPNSVSCPAGTAVDSGQPLVVNGDFSTPNGGAASAGEVIAASFTADIPYAGDDIYSFDTSITIQQGDANYLGGIVTQAVFPGDPANNVPATNTFLYSNGNNTGGPYTPWRQTISVEPNNTYLFVTYVSNMIEPGADLADEPIITFFADDMRLGETYTVTNETVAGGDVWTRISRVFTTGPTQTSTVLSFTDSAAGSIGDDLAMTVIGSFNCAATNNTPIANDDVVNTAERAPVTIDVLSNDNDPDGQSLTITSPIIAGPGNGTVQINSNGGVADTITYVPNIGFTGTDTFTYQITDGNGGFATATVTVVVTMLPDFDMDGIPDNFDIDDDNDGILDSEEGSGDFDQDGSPNSMDLDADGDGILDLEESGLNEAQQAALDADQNGQIDAGNSFGANGLADAIETAAESGTPDYDNDDVADSPINHDADTQPDFLDLDSDNDSIPDVIEAGLIDDDQNGQADPGQQPTMEPIDSDGDQVKDVHDLDSDNDGLTDALEAGSADADGDGRVDDFADGDADGLDDNTAANPAALPNTDGDSVPNYLDLDSDNDGLTDTLEGGLADADGNGLVDDFTDADNDGYDDNALANPAGIPNTDGTDGPDYLDLDSDGDGLLDIAEGGLTDADGDGLVDGFTDADGNGYDDATATNPAPVLDANGSDVPDFQEVPDPVEPNPPAAACCTLQTGLEGNGGSIGWMFVGLLGMLCLYRTGRTMKIALPAVFLSAIVAPPVLAEDDDFNKRLYLGLSAGISELEPRSPCGCQFVDDDQDTSVGLHLGYDLSQRVTLEAHYAQLGEAGIGLSATGEHQGEVDYEHFGVSALLYLLNNCGADEYDNFGLRSRQGLSLYGRIGVSNMDNDSNNIVFERLEDWHLHLGVGLEYGFANGFGLRAEYLSYDEDASTLTLSVIKRFGDWRGK